MENANQPKWSLILGAIAAVVVIVGTVIGILVTLRVINPSGPPVATPTPLNLTTYTDQYVGCTGKDNKLSDSNLWYQSTKDQANGYACSPAGLTITQPANASYMAQATLDLPPPHASSTHNYGISVNASNLSNGKTCVGILFRGDKSSAAAYDLEVCANGTWVLTKYLASNGYADPLNHGTVTPSSSYSISIQIDNNLLTAIVGPQTAPQSLPDMTLDSSYVADDYVGLTVDTGDPLRTDLNPTGPAGSATFSQFIFQPRAP